MNMLATRFVGFLAAASVAVASVAEASEIPVLRPSGEAWLLKSATDLELPPPPPADAYSL